MIKVQAISPINPIVIGPIIPQPLPGIYPIDPILDPVAPIVNPIGY